MNQIACKAEMCCDSMAGTSSSSSSSANGPVLIYDFGDHNFLVFEGADRLRTEFRLVPTSIYHTKNEQNELPTLPLVLMPEQVHVLFENGFAQIRRVKNAEEGSQMALIKQTRNGQKDGENSEAKNAQLHDLAQRILIGRQLKAQKRALLGADAPSNALKVRKLDRQKYAREQQQQNGEMELDEQNNVVVVQNQQAVDQLVCELRMREQQKGMDRMQLAYGFPSTSSAYEPVDEPKFPQTAEYAIRLTVFRDLWRKGFYLSDGTKFGCDFLAYERPPGEQHSRFMVVCADVNSPLKPMGMISVTRVSTQVNKRILMAIVSPGSPLPYYVEMNWWKGDGSK